MHSWISLGTKFQLKLTILIFWSKFARKGCFRSKTEISEYHHWLMRIWIGLVTEFHFKKQFWMPKKGISAQKQKKSEFHYGILHTRISLRTKFQRKLTIFMFWTKFAQKGYSQSKTENVNTTIEFCIFVLF